MQKRRQGRNSTIDLATLICDSTVGTADLYGAAAPASRIAILCLPPAPGVENALKSRIREIRIETKATAQRELTPIDANHVVVGPFPGTVPERDCWRGAWEATHWMHETDSQFCAVLPWPTARNTTGEGIELLSAARLYGSVERIRPSAIHPSDRQLLPTCAAILSLGRKPPSTLGASMKERVLDRCEESVRQSRLLWSMCARIESESPTAWLHDNRAKLIRAGLPWIAALNSTDLGDALSSNGLLKPVKQLSDHPALPF